METILKELDFEPFEHPFATETAYRLRCGPYTFEAARLTNKWLKECYFVSGTVNAGRTISLLETELPVEVESREVGLALLGYFIGPHVPEESKPPWLRIAERMTAYLPWSKEKDLPRLFRDDPDGLDPGTTSQSQRRNLYEGSDASLSVSVDLEIQDDGALELSGQDVGQSLQSQVGSDSYEYWVRLGPAATRRLFSILLAERYAANRDAVIDFRNLCAKLGVPHEYGTWPI